MLSLAEKLILLRIDEQKGIVKLPITTPFQYALIGATLIELILNNKVHIGEEYLEITDYTTTGNGILDEALQIIKQSKKKGDIIYWIAKLNNKFKNITDKILQKFIDEGVLEKLEHKFLWIIPAYSYLINNTRQEKFFKAHMRNEVINAGTLELNTIALFRLANVCDLVDDIFSYDEQKKAQIRIKQSLIDGKYEKTLTSVIAGIKIAIIAETYI